MTTTYRAPATVTEALGALARDPDSRVLAGGTDLIVGVRNGKHAMPQSLVAIHGIDELNRLTVDEAGGLLIGALVNHATLESSSIVQRRWTALSDGAALIGSPATRYVGTLGGNLANASPAMDTGAPLAVFEARVTLRSSDGDRTLAFPELLLGPGKSALRPGELLTGVRVPSGGEATGSAYVRLEYRQAMEIAVAGAAARVDLAEDGAVRLARIALSAVAPTIVRVPSAEAVLSGVQPTPDVLAEAAALTTGAARVISDARAGDTYRLAMVPIMARRALEVAIARARGQTVAIPANRYVNGGGKARG